MQVGARALWLHVHVHELGQLAAVTPKRHVARWGAVPAWFSKLALWTANALFISEGELGKPRGDGTRVHTGHFGGGDTHRQRAALRLVFTHTRTPVGLSATGALFSAARCALFSTGPGGKRNHKPTNSQHTTEQQTPIETPTTMSEP